jgi:hypothetical protein
VLVVVVVLDFSPRRQTELALRPRSRGEGVACLAFSTLPASNQEWLDREIPCWSERNETIRAVFNQGMKPLLSIIALFGMIIAAPQISTAETVVVHTHGGTAVHTNYNWNHAYWHSHKYGYWHGQRGYWHVVHGEHVFVVVQ